MNWQPIETAPTDGRAFWGFLYETGIRLLFWMSPEQCAYYEGCDDPDEYDGCWCEVSDLDKEWSPDWWLPADAIPLPSGAGIYDQRDRVGIARNLSDEMGDQK